MSMFHELMMRKKGMPERYQEVEYIEVAGRQYIDTGISGNSLYNYEIEYQCVNSGDRVFLCGVDENFSVKSSIFIRLANGDFSWYYDTYGTILFNNPDYNTAKNKLEVLYDINSNTVTTNVYSNDTKIGTTQRTIANIYNGNFFLGAINRNGSVTFDGTKRFYSAKFYNGTTLIRNFIPVYDTITQKYGMWESVERKFYGNAGTGDFKGSIVGYTVVGSLTESPSGVFSGFSSSDYLQVNNALPTTIGNNYVFEGEVSLSSLPSGTQYILSFNCNNNTGNSTFGFAFRSSGKFAIATSDGSSTTVTNGNLSYQANTIYKYRIETDLNTYVRLYINEELDLSLALSYTIVKPYNGNINYGVFVTTNLPLSNGSMNINNTSIKVNNKLVFNGQQA